MAEKRRLPVLQNSAPPAEAPADDAPPPWHWVPIGALVSIVTGTVLARSFYMPWMQRQVDAVYGVRATPAEYALAEAHVSAATRDALQLKLSLAGLAVALVSVAVGGLVVGRFGGGRTNPRHGTLAGITAMTLLVLFSGGRLGASAVLAYMALIPFGGLVGYLGALGGVVLRARAQRE